MFSKDDLPMLAILRGIAEKDLLPLSEVFSRTNIRFVEITMNTDGAPALITKLKTLVESNTKVGAGTVLSLEDLDDALTAGAEFIVTPSVIEPIIQKCVSQNIPVIPGALTPTEIHKAWNMGAAMVKVFPSSMFGTEYFKAIKGPFKDLKLIAVGGVDEQNISDFFRNGADAIGFGAGIIKMDWLSNNRYELMEESLLSLINCYKHEIR